MRYISSNGCMKTINEIRVDNARKLRDGVGGNTYFASRLDREATQISRIIGKNPTKKIGDDMARHIEACFDLQIGWLDREHGVETTPNKELAPVYKEIRYVPVISWVQAGAWTQSEPTEVNIDELEHFPCPVPCGENTYILRVVGESMYPEYMPGEMIFVDPDVPPYSGDDVVALMVDTGETTFKRYMVDGFSKALKALNPNWPTPYIEINGTCRLLGTVIFSGKPRKKR